MTDITSEDRARLQLKIGETSIDGAFTGEIEYINASGGPDQGRGPQLSAIALGILAFVSGSSEISADPDMHQSGTADGK